MKTRVQTALAHVLVNDAVRNLLFSEPVVFQQRFGLSAGDVAILRSAGKFGLTLTVRSIRGKRLDFLKRALPLATELAPPSLLQAYASTVAPLVSRGQTSRLVLEGERFLEYLSGIANDESFNFLLDLANYEFTIVDLVASKEARSSAKQCARGHSYVKGLLAEQELDYSLRLRVGGHVRLKRFSHDVISFLEAPSVGNSPSRLDTNQTFVLFAKSPRGSVVHTYRLGMASYNILGLCDGSRTLRDLFAALRPSDVLWSEQLKKTVETLKLAAAQALLCISSEKEAS